MPFKPIALDAYLELHLSNNPTENRRDFLARLHAALGAHRAGDLCDCGSSIWVIGSAVARHACFTCITGEAVPVDDYEIQEACQAVCGRAEGLQKSR